MSILKNKTALVTGSTGGIGSAIAGALAKEGCKMVLHGRSFEKLSAIHRRLVKTYDANSRMIEADGAPLSSDSRFDNIDILVNCAGVFHLGSIESCPVETFDEIMNVNVRLPFLLTQRVAPDMARRGWGRIVNIGSSSAYLGGLNTAAYCTSKHALLGLSRAANREFRDRGVRVFCVSPSSTQTELGHRLGDDGNFNKFIMPEDIARHVVFAISFDGNSISEEIRINRVKF